MKRPKKKEQPAQMTISEEQFFEPFDAIHRDENAFIGFGSKRGESAVSL